MAEALIKIGVRCVVAAGWAIDDEAAHVFATTFYSKLLGGSEVHRRGRRTRAVTRANVAETRGPRTSAMAILIGDTGAELATPSDPLRRRPKKWPVFRPLPPFC